MTVLIDAAGVARRREIAAGPLAPLADSLAAELHRLLPDGDPFIPSEKAKLTRTGGRCVRDGALLEFDPHSPRRHRCPQCGAGYDGEEHYRWWVMGYQLWLAERAAQAAVLWALRGDQRARSLAEGILAGLAEKYESYPNADNVLGPTRPFFSTYLESLWLLQIIVAVDVLDASDAGHVCGAARERLVAPSAHLIASYDEGDSNRQVWNNAAIAAAGRLLDRPDWVEAAVHGASGLVAHLTAALLADGTWYEGENYHLFAHRGLWYAVTLAEHAGVTIPADLVRRFEHGFATPFLSALPDFTFPSRRDSQYRVSLRQWRIAESCELGLGRQADDRLARALGQLYRTDVAPGDTARWRSTADAERNVPAALLTRADLGWKSLLFASPEPRLLPESPAASALLEGQGLAILRRGAGRAYVALDYGTSGGGHGHPDRLNLWLVNGAERVLEDVGTGSYVDPTLHWYRSTLAHNAPLVDGHSQARADGWLRAWQEGDETGWVRAECHPAPGVLVRRSVMARPGYLVDALEWEASRPVTLDVPWHVDAETQPSLAWQTSTLAGGDGLEDGFSFVAEAARASAPGVVSLVVPAATGWVAAPDGAEWWRCVAPGPPGSGARRFYLVRQRGARGRLLSVWSWDANVRSVEPAEERVHVRFADGTSDVHTWSADAWHVVEHRGASVRETVLAGVRKAPAPAERAAPAPTDAMASAAIPALPLVTTAPPRLGDLTRNTASGPAPLRFRLGREHYRRAESSWLESGSPEALVSLAATASHLLVEVSVRKAPLVFAPPRDANPLDNEHPDINSDGVQLHLGRQRPPGDASCAWLLVPESASSAVRVTPRSAEAASIPVDAAWRPTAQGYQMLVRVPRRAAGLVGTDTCRLDVLINEISPDRERRRGQLVLSGARGEWVYLRGDRQDPDRYLTFSLPDV